MAHFIFVEISDVKHDVGTTLRHRLVSGLWLIDVKLADTTSDAGNITTSQKVKFHGAVMCIDVK